MTVVKRSELRGTTHGSVPTWDATVGAWVETPAASLVLQGLQGPPGPQGPPGLAVPGTVTPDSLAAGTADRFIVLRCPTDAFTVPLFMAINTVSTVTGTSYFGHGWAVDGGTYTAVRLRIASAFTNVAHNHVEVYNDAGDTKLADSGDLTTTINSAGLGEWSVPMTSGVTLAKGAGFWVGFSASGSSQAGSLGGLSNSATALNPVTGPQLAKTSTGYTGTVPAVIGALNFSVYIGAELIP